MLRASLCAALMSFVDGADSQRASKPSVFMAYFTNWHQWSLGFKVEDIPASKITHVNFAFAMIGSKSYVEDGVAKPYSIRHFEDNDIGQNGSYLRLNVGLKKKYPHLKTLISVGGWSFDLPEKDDAESAKRMKRLDPGWTHTIFSDIVGDKSNRAKFIQSCLEFCDKYKFDGIDLDWEYPGATDRGGRTSDKANFKLLLEEMRAAIDNKAKAENTPKLLFTAAVGVGAHRVDAGYDVPALNKNLDFVNLMTYDLYGGWDITTGARIHSQLYHSDSETLSGAWAVNYWKERGLAPNKITLGWVTYGRSFKLESATPGQLIGSKVTGGRATTSYQQTSQMIQDGATATHDATRCAAYLQKEDLWIGYDDVKSMECKARFIANEGLLGGFVWSMAEDDFKKGSPLITAFSQNICLPAGIYDGTCAHGKGGNDEINGGNNSGSTRTETAGPVATTAATTKPQIQTTRPTETPHSAKPTTTTTQSAVTPKDMTPKPPSTNVGEDCTQIKKHSQCEPWAAQGICKKTSGCYHVIKPLCEAYCNCVEANDNANMMSSTKKAATNAISSTAMPTTTFTPPDCKDSLGYDCKGWSKYCHLPGVKDACPKSCGACSGNLRSAEVEEENGGTIIAVVVIMFCVVAIVAIAGGIYAHRRNRNNSIAQERKE